MNALAGSKDLYRTFTVWAFAYLLLLMFHFSVRKVLFESYTLNYGFWVYMLCIPATIVSLLMLRGKMPWSFSVGGLLCLAFSIFGYYADYVLAVPWRSSIDLPILIPYVALYLGTLMFYWFPLGLISRKLWYAYAVLFLLSTILNITSH